MLQTAIPARPQDEGERNLASPVSLVTANPYREPAEAVVASLGSDVARGLSRAEVQRRLE